MKIYTDDFFVLTGLKKDGLSNLQTINLSVNTTKTGEELKEKLCTDLSRIFLLAEGETPRVSVVVSKTPFLHGSVDMFFENERLARYVFTSAPISERTDWRVYAPAMEIFLRENSGELKIKRAVLNSVWEDKTLAEYLGEKEEKTLTKTALENVEGIVAKVI